MKTRREFLSTVAAAAVAAAKGPELRFPTAPRDRIAVASYPFRKFIDAPNNWERDRKQAGFDLTQFPAMVVQRFGVHNIEPLGAHFVSLEPAWLEQFRSAVEKAGSHVIDIAAAVGGSLYDPDTEKRSAAVARGKKWVDAAAAVRSPSVRIHIQGVRDTPPDAGRAEESLRALADYGESKGVAINLENDDLVSEDAFFLVKVIEDVKSPYLRALPDFGNSILKGDEKFNYDAVAAMFRHAWNVCHVKDSEVYKGKVYRVDMRRTFDIVKSSGYRGYFSMEWEGEGGPYEGTESLIRQTVAELSR